MGSTAYDVVMASGHPMRAVGYLMGRFTMVAVIVGGVVHLVRRSRRRPPFPPTSPRPYPPGPWGPAAHQPPPPYGQTWGNGAAFTTPPPYGGAPTPGYASYPSFPAGRAEGSMPGPPQHLATSPHAWRPVPWPDGPTRIVDPRGDDGGNAVHR